MKVLTISDLLNLTKAEILEIRRTLTIQLGELPQGSVEHQEAAETLANIEIVLVRLVFRMNSNRAKSLEL